MSFNENKIKAFQRLKKKLTKENLWLYVLRLLQEKPRYGYEIKSEIKNRFNFSPATVTGYVILYKMEKDGLVEAKWERNEQGRPDRKYYEITERGEKAMKLAKKFLMDLMNTVFDKTS